MNEETIINGWLLISNRIKANIKQRDVTTNKGRSPLGDKGLGRLGAQRLGYNVELETKPDAQNIDYHVAFSWRDFLSVERLTDVPVTIEELVPASRKRGTKLIISNLQNTGTWQGETAASDLEKQLSQMISPFEEIRDFDIVATLDGKRLELATISEGVRDTALIRYKIDFDGRRFSVKGKIRLEYVRPSISKQGERDLFHEIVDSDNAREFLKFLSLDKRAEEIHLRSSDEEGWFVEFEYINDFDNLDKLVFIDELEPANPGPFHGEIDYFELEAEDALRSALDSLSEYRKFIAALRGIKVYRDGFGIHVDDDWLGLGRQFTGQTSFYSLRPANTIGYIALTARYNARLEETTDRQGFIDTPYYRNFYELLKQFVAFTGRAQEFLRRGWNRFRDDHRQRLAELDER